MLSSTYTCSHVEKSVHGVDKIQHRLACLLEELYRHTATGASGVDGRTVDVRVSICGVDIRHCQVWLNHFSRQQPGMAMLLA